MGLIPMEDELVQFLNDKDVEADALESNPPDPHNYDEDISDAEFYGPALRYVYSGDDTPLKYR